MDQLEFVFGVTLAIIGIVVAEIIIQGLKEKKEIHNIIKSIGYEVCENIAIHSANLKKLRNREIIRLVPFKTLSYDRFKQSMSEKLIKKLEKKAIEYLYVGYMYCSFFNRNLDFCFKVDTATFLQEAHSTKNLLTDCMKEIKTNFDKFQQFEKTKDKVK